jgi:hypothetical protein
VRWIRKTTNGGFGPWLNEQNVYVPWSTEGSELQDRNESISDISQLRAVHSGKLLLSENIT